MTAIDQRSGHNSDKDVSSPASTRFFIDPAFLAAGAAILWLILHRKRIETAVGEAAESVYGSLYTDDNLNQMVVNYWAIKGYTANIAYNGINPYLGVSGIDTYNWLYAKYMDTTFADALGEYIASKSRPWWHWALLVPLLDDGLYVAGYWLGDKLGLYPDLHACVWQNPRFAPAKLWAIEQLEMLASWISEDL